MNGVFNFRRFVQWAIVVAAAGTGLSLARGWSLTSVEKYCPMGGLATAWSVLTRARYSCATGEYNLALIAALLLLAVLARKSFCAWICPVGTIGEGLARLGARLRGKKSGWGFKPVSIRGDRWVRWLRWLVLMAVVGVTIRTAELHFRPFCPYYVMFSFHGHDVALWSYPLVAALLVLALVIPMAWCRYLCPLGCALGPLSRVGLLRIARDANTCTDCQACDRSCPQGLRVASVAQVNSGECTLCLECLRACPAPDTLRLKAVGFGGRRSLTGWSVPGLVAGLAAIGLWGGSLASFPSLERAYAAQADNRSLTTLTLKVRGIRCVDTAAQVASQLNDLDGVARFTAYASRHQAVIQYDPRRIRPADIQRAIEGPVLDEDTGQFVFHVFQVLEMDGKSVEQKERSSD